MSVLGWDIPVAPNLPFWTNSGNKDLGWQLRLASSYAYSEDLTSEAGYSHYFVGEGIDDGAFLDGNGLGFIGGQDNDDVDYMYVMTTIEFSTP